MITYEKTKAIFEKLSTKGDFESFSEEKIDLFKNLWGFRQEIPEYTPTDDERKIISKLTGLPKDWLEHSIFRIFEPGKLLVRTSDASWRCLMGREFLVNLNSKEALLIGEN